MSPRLKVLSLVLGVLILMFGFLKFFQPFDGWFHVQIERSHLPQQALLAGKVGEMVTGFLFLLPWMRRGLPVRTKSLILMAAGVALVGQMLVAIYVHLQPQVPASVLPLGIKPPVIPGVVLLLEVVAVWDAWRAFGVGEGGLRAAR